MKLSHKLFPWKRLQALGVLGLNRRNADFILPYNSRKNFPLVDDKLRTKQLAEKSGISVPPLYGVIEIEHQISELEVLAKNYDEFVIKPTHGCGGEGILVVSRISGGKYRLGSGECVESHELHYHLSCILSGMYSLGGRPDSALLEYKVNFDPVFEGVSFQGCPDIRVIVFRGIPVMAMLRLPTKLSCGKANLHQGAIGVGIDISEGFTFYGVWREHIIDRHPDTGSDILGLMIPQWDYILEISARCQGLVGLGYLGIDIVIDSKLGPLMLEMNARPGLGIQLANKSGLLFKLNKLKRMGEMPVCMGDRLLLAKSLGCGVEVGG